jgi:hypothetical protein
MVPYMVLGHGMFTCAYRPFVLELGLIDVRGRLFYREEILEGCHVQRKAELYYTKKGAEQREQWKASREFEHGTFATRIS